MSKKIQILFLISIFFSNFASAETNTEVLAKVWNIGSSNACTPEARSKFSEQNFKKLISKISNEQDLEELKVVLNPFLKTLGWSHTEFMTSRDEGFYLFRGHSSSVNPDYPLPPLIVNPGLQIGQDSKGYYVREILDGFSAKQSGVLKNDRIVNWKGNLFDGTWGCHPSTGELLIERNNRRLNFIIFTEKLNWNDAFLQATKNSEKIIFHKGKRIGYVHLWTGIHKDSAQVLQQIIRRLSPQIDGLVFDIRGGYGGAWWEHLDPFFKDRTNFFEAQIIDGDGKKDSWLPELQSNTNSYQKKMVVLINEGSRSGKEALAYQFKKSQRAKIVGSRTAGYFSGGSFFFTDQPVNYVLYLCTLRISLDGNEIEGRGIEPDIFIPYANTGDYLDSQLERALDEVAR